MLPARILLILRRRPILRHLLSLIGYLGGAAAMLCGGILFYAGPVFGDQIFASGLLLCGGLGLMIWTHEARKAIRALPVRKPDPIES
ncbi:hypothetical protein NS226_04100 [Aureimonas ureilytica]|uniref:Uncharacterized protein n=1 Tax=Aureimonas ureilytica TaxID=401562 RepID=A0A175RF53_9HYPH|nr:hypothetical protein [Aureimonas ureilytica]KTQ97824.1 hypothetical protein NS226_04100 [Aureimonas ureilytica]